MLITERQANGLFLTLNRPEKGNALHPRLIDGIRSELEHAEADDDVRVVILTGTGRTFCAGLDLDQLMELDEDGRIAYMRSVFSLFRQVYELRQPVIAAVNGAAFAGGFDLAVFCDVRFCAPEARFAQTEILLGLTQIMYPLYQLVGLSRAKEWAMTGEPIDADEAHRVGLVNRIYPRDELVPEALRFAETLASRPREALFETKRLSRELVDLDADRAMDRMLDAIVERLRSDEHREALRAYVESLVRRREARRRS